MTRIALLTVAVLAAAPARSDSVKTARPSDCFCPFFGAVRDGAALGRFEVDPATRVATFVVTTPLLPDAAGRMPERGQRVAWGRDAGVAAGLHHFVFGMFSGSRCAEQVAPDSPDPEAAAVVALDCSGGHLVERSGLGMCVARVTVSEVLRLAALLQADATLDCAEAFVAQTGLDGAPDGGCSGGSWQGLALFAAALGVMRVGRRSRARGAPV